MDQGKAEADDGLPDLPPECNVDTPHAPLGAGMEARSAIKRERHQLDLSNASKRRCTAFYGNLKTERTKN